MQEEGKGNLPGERKRLRIQLQRQVELKPFSLKWEGTEITSSGNQKNGVEVSPKKQNEDRDVGLACLSLFRKRWRFQDSPRI